MKTVSRRNFLKASGALGGGLLWTLGAGQTAGASVLSRAASSLTSTAETGAKWGAYAEPWGSITKPFDALVNLETLLGRQFEIHRAYLGMDIDIVNSNLTRLADRGTTPYRSFHAWTTGRVPLQWADIAAGKHDAWLERQASMVAAWGRPMYMAFHHEPENDVNGFIGSGEGPCGTAADYRAAYHHVRDVFTPATNLTWVVTLMNSTFAGRRGGWQQFFPGDRFDLVGVDGYNRGSYTIGPDKWKTFTELFNPAYQVAQSLGKQLFIGESACAEEGGDKADWVNKALYRLKQWGTGVHAVCWSHIGSSPMSSGESISSFWMDSSPQALAAFAAAGADPYFK